MGLTLDERFWSKVDKQCESDCWLWLKGIDVWGYGRFRMPNGHVGAHRMAYELTYGLEPYDPENPIVVRHKCDNPPCCNPRHLELGTHVDNVRDKIIRGRDANAIKTHCKYGHEFTPSNTYRWRGSRYCKKCNNKHAKLRRQVRM